MGSRGGDHRIQSVLHLLNAQSPLTLKQEKFCNNACVARFLEAKGGSVRKAAKHLRSSLSWRGSFGVDHLTADEFSAELAEGMAYVAGHDHQLRPVIIFRIKQDYQKFHSLKPYTRLLVFTLEVAVQSMARNVEQFVLLFDAKLFRSAPPFMNTLIATLKIIADHYPRRLHKAFIIDPPSLFSCLWKGVRAFVELSSTTVVVSSSDLEESYPSLGFNNIPTSISSAPKLGSSSRFSFTVSHHFDSLKPWYLSFKDTSDSESKLNGHDIFLRPRISPINARSLSFASPIARGDVTPMPQKLHPSSTPPKPWFLQSPAALFSRKESGSSSESFAPLFKIYQSPYDEMIYRSKMRPPLSVVSPRFRRTHMSISQRF